MICKTFINLLIILILSSCAETRFIINSAKKISDINEKPKYKVGDPYKINGQWYYPKVDYNYDEIGIASWYGPNFHGKKTANGEIFNQYKVSAAHKTLPLPTIVKVTNLENNISLKIRINDRGPFVRGRIIDLSKEAAKKLKILNKGTAKVRVKVIEEESRKIANKFYNYKNFVSDAGKSEKVLVKNLDEKKIDNMVTYNFEKKKLDNKVSIQVAAFNDIRNANLLKSKLFEFSAFIQRKFINGQYFYRVRLGPYKDRSIAKKILEKLNLRGFTKSKIIIESSK